MDKRLDEYSVSFTREDDLLGELQEMEANSEWIEDIDAKNITVHPVESPAFAREFAQTHGIDETLGFDSTCTDIDHDDGHGSRLAVTYIDSNGKQCAGFLRECARPGLIHTVVGLGGARQAYLTPVTVAQCANLFLQDAKFPKNSKVLMLERYGKISGMYSGNSDGYGIMPISRLVEITREKLHDNFGDADFLEGHNSHSFTDAAWTLPDAQNDILQIYNDALGNGGSLFPLNFMPGVRLESSDTGNCSATLTPVFFSSLHEFRFIDGVSVKHTKRVGPQGLAGLELFEAEANDLYAMFKNVGEVIKRLAGIRIYNPENCIVSLCNRYKIGKQYGDYARELASRLCGTGSDISAHDLYLCMTTIVRSAKDAGATSSQVKNLSEAVGRIPGADWSAHDVGGIVAWA